MRIITYTEYEIRSVDDFSGLMTNGRDHDLKEIEAELRRQQERCERQGYSFGEWFIVERSGIRVKDEQNRFVTETVTRRTVAAYSDGKLIRL